MINDQWPGYLSWGSQQLMGASPRLRWKAFATISATRIWIWAFLNIRQLLLSSGGRRSRCFWPPWCDWSSFACDSFQVVRLMFSKRSLSKFDLFLFKNWEPLHCGLISGGRVMFLCLLGCCSHPWWLNQYLEKGFQSNLLAFLSYDLSKPAGGRG